MIKVRARLSLLTKTAIEQNRITKQQSHVLTAAHQLFCCTKFGSGERDRNTWSEKNGAVVMLRQTKAQKRL
jgi:hypothetical protein